MSSSLFRKVALVRWLIGSRPFEKSPGLVLKSKSLPDPSLRMGAIKVLEMLGTKQPRPVKTVISTASLQKP